ncbi:meiotic nuclear division protein 1 homolog [Anneissia japonica]|uniref:meiotic nuclear division protein 1 homolog n=1 Tax=Anneissia japonica TaxID=1529436 RepID=UPI001425871B|nr:meiotic nuclear division protein 1 homolog [Anneissia japonica]
MATIPLVVSEKGREEERGGDGMSVKEVVQSLVDDAMVDTDRIGTSNYFWAFPSKASQTRKRKILDLSEALEQSETKHKVTKKKIQEAVKGKEDSDERTDVLKELQEKEKRLAEVSAELERFRDCDPEVMDNMKKESKTALEAANRWTDNIFSIQSWCRKKFSIETKKLNKQFGIPEDFDYIE